MANWERNVQGQPNIDSLNLSITATPYSDSEYTALVYAGLYELRARGEIEIVFEDRLNAQQFAELPQKATVLLTAREAASGLATRIGYDLQDGAGIASKALLEDADVYFKRSYRQAVIDRLPANQRIKVRPFGLHYACTSASQTLTDQWRFLQANRRIRSGFPGADKNWKALSHVVRRTGSLLCAQHWTYRCPSSLPPLISELETSANAPATPSIFYRTRVYEPLPHSPDRGESENAFRVATIRALKQRFGQRFVGGLRDSDYARKHFPDCIFREDLNWRGHLTQLKQHLIAVTTAGLHDSTDWKLPEYLAAARCIVAESPRFELPTPLQIGSDVLTFTTPQECVEACERVLGDQDLGDRLRAGAQRYYQRYLAPAALIGRTLREALERLATETDSPQAPATRAAQT